MISPYIRHRFAGFQSTDRTFPIINIIYSVAMRQTTTGETDKTWMDISNGLCKVGTQSVFLPLKVFCGNKEIMSKPYFPIFWGTIAKTASVALAVAVSTIFCFFHLSEVTDKVACAISLPSLQFKQILIFPPFHLRFS